MTSVDFVYHVDCPGITTTRTNLMRAFAAASMQPRWSEHRIGDSDAPDHVRGYGSPTLLIGGRDVVGIQRSAEDCCRLYASAAGSAQAPSVQEITEALLAATNPSAAVAPKGKAWRSNLAALPGLGFALLPKLACPACWPAYASVLTSLGIGFLMEAQWLLPLTVFFLSVAVAALAVRARQRRGFGPFFLGTLASAIVLGSKFGVESNPAMYAGLGLLVAASLWNTWPNRSTPACPTCVTS